MSNIFRAFKALGWFFALLGAAAMIPQLRIDFLNLADMPLGIKMFFVVALGFGGIAMLIKLLDEVAV